MNLLVHFICPHTQSIIICTQADHLHSDHHSIAKSVKDGTVGLPHMVLSEPTASEYLSYMKINDSPIPYLSKSSFTTLSVKSILPDDSTLDVPTAQTWSIDFC
jgi:hypothetical protein